MQIPNSKITRWFLVTSLLLVLAGSADSMSQPPKEPVLIEFVGVGYEKDAGAIVAELVVPNIDAIEDLSRIELLICHANNEATFGVMLNRSDRCNPIPPGNFGVIIDPSSDDRSIKNVSSAGFNVEWDQASPPWDASKAKRSRSSRRKPGYRCLDCPAGLESGSLCHQDPGSEKKTQPGTLAGTG